MIPSEDDVGRIERDLRFSPATTAHPTTLSPRDVAAFNRDGFITNFRIFDDHEIDEYRRYFDALLERLRAAGTHNDAINEPHLRHARAYDLLAHPRIVAYVTDLLGADVIGWGSHYFCKPPHDPNTIPWHQDAVYWPLTPSKTVNIWLALDDADVENACMYFIPSSHRRGGLYRPHTQGTQGHPQPAVTEAIAQYGEPVPAQLQAGEISIHSDLVLHGSGANHSSRRRARLALRYCAPEVHAYLGWHNKGVIVSGRDPSGHWTNPARPEMD